MRRALNSAPALPSPARMRSEAELAGVLDAIAARWRVSSQREIARQLGLERGAVSGLVMRARRNGDGEISASARSIAEAEAATQAEVGRRGGWRSSLRAGDARSPDRSEFRFPPCRRLPLRRVRRLAARLCLVRGPSGATRLAVVSRACGEGQERFHRAAFLAAKGGAVNALKATACIAEVALLGSTATIAWALVGGSSGHMIVAPMIVALLAVETLRLPLVMNVPRLGLGGKAAALALATALACLTGETTALGVENAS